MFADFKLKKTHFDLHDLYEYVSAIRVNISASTAVMRYDEVS